jgi:hypothetical protein
VKGNVFRFEGVKGLGETGAMLIAVAADGHELWSGPGGG